MTMSPQAFRTRAVAAVLAWLLPALAGAATPAPDASPIYARIDVDAIGPGPLQQLQQTPGLAWWIELDDRLLVLAGEAVLDSLGRDFAVERLAVETRPARLHLVRGARRDDLAAMDVDLLAAGGRYAVVQARRDQPPALPAAAGGHRHATLLPFAPDLVLARQQANQEPRRRSLSARAGALIDEVDEQRWFNDLTALAGYNRWTHGDEIDMARDWLVDQFETLPGLTVETPVFEVGSTAAFNVVATLTGTLRPDDLYIVGGHYDATSQSAAVAAPGAEDNASGCAGVLEMARIFTANPPEATVLFICYSGEEQGLHGSVDHASGLVAAGLDDQVLAVLTMDMIGFTEDADLDCLLETSSGNAALADAFAAAATLTDLRIVVSFSPFGSDHVPYLGAGMPALLTIENDWSSYPCYHSTCDTPDNITLAMGREVLKMNVATMAELAGIETTIFADGFESGDTSSWSKTTAP